MDGKLFGLLIELCVCTETVKVTVSCGQDLKLLFLNKEGKLYFSEL